MREHTLLIFSCAGGQCEKNYKLNGLSLSLFLFLCTMYCVGYQACDVCRKFDVSLKIKIQSSVLLVFLCSDVR